MNKSQDQKLRAVVVLLTGLANRVIFTNWPIAKPKWDRNFRPTSSDQGQTDDSEDMVFGHILMIGPNLKYEKRQ